MEKPSLLDVEMKGFRVVVSNLQGHCVVQAQECMPS